MYLSGIIQGLLVGVCPTHDVHQVFEKARQEVIADSFVSGLGKVGCSPGVVGGAGDFLVLVLGV